jgi:DNA repair exonuclease SbcCD nuclease subunit
MVFGDIHKPQALHSDPLVMYVGSPDKITFGEATDDKRFIVYDLSDGSYESIPIPTRSFVDIKVDLERRMVDLAGAVNGEMPLGDGEYMVCLRAFLKVMADSIKDSVVKFSASGHKNSLDQVLRHEIADTLQEFSPHKIKAITFTVTDNTAIRDKAYSTALTDYEAFKYWLSKQSYGEAMAEMVKAEGVKLLERK